MPKLKDFKALFFDIDRTLVQTNHHLPESVIKNLHQLDEMGYLIGVCTGRGFSTIQNYILRHFPKNNLHILNGGGEIISTMGDTVYQDTIPAEIVKPIIKVINKDRKSFLSTHDYLYGADNFINDYLGHPWKFKAKPMSQYQNEPVFLICAMDITRDNIVNIPQSEKLSIKYLTNNEGKPYVDMTKKGTSKETALKAWSKITGIPLSQVIGFGDSPNDLEFLDAIGCGVAMGNANEEVKNIADHIIGDVDQNGLSAYLSKIISGKDL